MQELKGKLASVDLAIREAKELVNIEFVGQSNTIKEMNSCFESMQDNLYQIKLKLPKVKRRDEDS